MAENNEQKIELSINGHKIPISNSNKIYFKSHNETKLDLIYYYEQIEEAFFISNLNRPTLMQRYPNGAHGKDFYQKRVPETAPKWLSTTMVETPNGTKSQALVLKDLSHVVWANNLGCLGFHTWSFTVDEPDTVSELRIDLDLTPGTNFSDIKICANQIKQLLDELGLDSFIKTTGKNGIHIYCPLKAKWDSYEVRSAAVALAREMERRHPKTITAEWWKEERGERIFIDYNQNAPHKTVFAAWGVRATDIATVSTPFYWDDLDTVEPEQFTIKSVPQIIKTDGNPWAEYNTTKNDLTPLLEMSKTDFENGLLDAPWPPQYPKQPLEPPRVSPSRAKKPEQ